MSKYLRGLLVSALSVVAFGAVAANASAAVTTTSGAGPYTATTTTNQTLSAPTPFGTLTISCAQSAVFSVTRLSGAVAGDTVASLTGVTFTCLNGATARVLTLPLPIVLNSATTSVLNATIGNSTSPLTVQVTTALGSCLFRGTIPFSLGNGTAAGNLAGATLTLVSGICNGSGTVSSAPYSVSPSYTYTGTA
jgi:hypothetical protein